VRILFDQGTPNPLRNYLAGHEVTTAAEKGWSTLSNGELLDMAEREFDVLVTTDQALGTQQNLSGRKLAILVLPFASWPRLEPNAEKLAARVATLRAGEYVQIDLE
jgi:predicted nuclease of predicted toxin-antitoxin system